MTNKREKKTISSHINTIKVCNTRLSCESESFKQNQKKKQKTIIFTYTYAEIVDLRRLQFCCEKWDSVDCVEWNCWLRACGGNACFSCAICSTDTCELIVRIVYPTNDRLELFFPVRRTEYGDRSASDASTRNTIPTKETQSLCMFYSIEEKRMDSFSTRSRICVL